MKKIPCLFQRDRSGPSRTALVRDEVVPGSEWVINGEGVATKKWDGCGCLVRDGSLYKRYEVKCGKKQPPNFEPCCEVDPITGKQQGWVPVSWGPEDQWFREAFDASEKMYRDLTGGPIPNNTYELCGPKIQSNREGFPSHILVPHGHHELPAPRTFDALREWLRVRDIEGIVWWHPDGRMVKLRKEDFGMSRT
jgi:hypothetical protein